MFTTDKNNVGDIVPYESIKAFISKHISLQPRYDKLDRYYRGEHDILKRDKTGSLANNRIVCNHAKDITDTVTGYFVGEPIKYVGDNAATLLDWFNIANIPSVDMSLGKSMSKFGIAYELICMSDDEKTTPLSFCIDPRNTFVVCDDTLQHRPLFGVYYYPTYDMSLSHTGYKVNVYTKSAAVEYVADTNFNIISEGEAQINPFDDVPIIAYDNNDERQGDYEQVTNLIDAYNTLMSDRVNDKEQFVDALLLIVNGTLADTEEEAEEVCNRLKRDRILELPGETDAKYLFRTFDESGVDILRKAIKEDIHSLAMVPCLSDENFASNASGVAIEYKLLGLEEVVKTKQRKFTEAAKRRIALYNRINMAKGGTDFGKVELTFTRGLPKNITDLANVVSQLDGVVPQKLLLPLLPFVKDVDEAMQLLKQEKEQNADESMRQFGMQLNTPLGDDDE